MKCLKGTSICPEHDTSTDPTFCEYTRKLCVTCVKAGDTVTIRVQSDNIPSHCVYAVYQPEEYTMDWSATWLPAVADSLVAANNVMDQGGVDGLLCNYANNTAEATIPAASNYVQNEGY